MSYRNMLRLMLVTSMLLACASSFAGDSLKVLFIGNSYTHMNEMPFIFEKIAKKSGKDVIVEMNAKSGASFREHSGRSDMYQSIKKRQWDYVILQGYSRELSFPKAHIDTATIPFVNQILDSIYLNYPCTNVMFYMTWGYADGFTERPEIDSYEKMADSVKVGYDYIGAYFNLPVVPVGMVWKDIHQNTKIDLYYSDRAHPSKAGSYLIASTFYGAIFDDAIEKDYQSGIRRRYSKLIANRMYDFIQAHREAYKLDRNRFEIKYYTTKNGEFTIDYMGNYPDATSVIWDFGNGVKSSSLKGLYRYEKAGNYTITIEVQDFCGTRQITRDVYFNPIKKPRKRKRSKPKKHISIDRRI